MGKIGYERFQQAAKRKGVDNTLEVKKKLGEASLLASFERTHTIESNQSIMLVEAPTPALASMTGPTKSLEAIQPVSSTSPTMSSGRDHLDDLLTQTFSYVLGRKTLFFRRN